MNVSKKQSDSVLSKLEKIQKWFRISYLILGPTYIFGIVIYKGIINFGFGVFQAFVLGLFFALVVFGILLLVDFGLLAWDKSTTWLSKQLKKYPKIRSIVIIPLAAGITFGSIFISIVYWPFDNLSRVVFFIYFCIFLPAALLSFLRDEKDRDEHRLSKQITPELIMNNPQAAIEHAFTLFEDYLRKRLNAGPDIYGDALINFAYGQNGRLIFSDLESENKGARNFIAGAYATFRNPRKHRIVQDDEQTAFAIVSLVELLFKIVDESKDNNLASS